jgi:hypothetical protein
MSMSTHAFVSKQPRQTLSPGHAAKPPYPDLRPLLTRLSAEVAARLTKALDRLGDLADNERLDGRILQDVADEVAGARRVGMIGQQIVRLASGHVRPEAEPVMVSEMLEALAATRRLSIRNETEIRVASAPSRMHCDPSLLNALLHSLMDWCTSHAASAIDFGLQAATPRQGLTLTATICVRASQVEHSLDSLDWDLLDFSAQALGVRLSRKQSGEQVTTELQWPLARLPIDPPVLIQGLPMAGCQVLVVAPEREMRNRVRLAIRGLDLLVDYVPSVDAATRYCADGRPEAIVYDGRLDGPEIASLQENLLRLEPGLPFIEVSKTVGEPPQLRPGTSRLAMDDLMGSLPSTLATRLAGGH